MAAFEAYRQHEMRWFRLYTTDPFTKNNSASEALRVIQHLHRFAKPMIIALAVLDTLFPDMQRARVLNMDSKGSTQWLLFYPTRDATAPLVRIATRDFTSTPSKYCVELYDCRADTRVVRDSNVNYILDDITWHPPALKHEADTLQHVADFIGTKPAVPVFDPATDPYTGCVLV